MKDLPKVILDYQGKSPMLEKKSEISHLRKNIGILKKTKKKASQGGQVNLFIYRDSLKISQPLQRNPRVCGGFRNRNPYNEGFL